LVQITMWSGVSADVKKKLVEEITAAFERQEIPKEAVSIIIYEVPKENWGSGGILHSLKFSQSQA